MYIILMNSGLITKISFVDPGFKFNCQNSKELHTDASFKLVDIYIFKERLGYLYVRSWLASENCETWWLLMNSGLITKISFVDPGFKFNCQNSKELHTDASFKLVDIYIFKERLGYLYVRSWLASENCETWWLLILLIYHHGNVMWGVISIV